MLDRSVLRWGGMAAMAGAGIGWIQIRAKHWTGRELYRALDHARMSPDVGTVLTTR